MASALLPRVLTIFRKLRMWWKREIVDYTNQCRPRHYVRPPPLPIPVQIDICIASVLEPTFASIVNTLDPVEITGVRVHRRLHIFFFRLTRNHGPGIKFAAHAAHRSMLSDHLGVYRGVDPQTAAFQVSSALFSPHQRHPWSILIASAPMCSNSALRRPAPPPVPEHVSPASPPLPAAAAPRRRRSPPCPKPHPSPRPLPAPGLLHHHS